MIKEFWINLPVKDVQKSKEFFIKIGFKLNPHYGNTENSTSFLIGQKSIVLMLFEESTFKGFTSTGIPNTLQFSEVLLSIDTENKEEVDEMVRIIIEAGGKSNHVPYEMQGWMYGCIFSDLDGHRWNLMYMDWSKMPK
jgi:predicted lactoylglutathione lyase